MNKFHGDWSRWVVIKQTNQKSDIKSKTHIVHYDVISGIQLHISAYIEAIIMKGKYLEEYVVLNMKTGNGKVGRIEN